MQNSNRTNTVILPIMPSSEDLPLMGASALAKGAPSLTNERRRCAIPAATRIAPFLLVTVAILGALVSLVTLRSRGGTFVTLEFDEEGVHSYSSSSVDSSLGTSNVLSNDQAMEEALDVDIQPQLLTMRSKSKSKYTHVQTLSFSIYTGGAPAFKPNEDDPEGDFTNEANDECMGLHSFGKPEGDENLQCYLGLEDSAMDIERRLGIMVDAVDKAYNASNKDETILKIFLAPEFFFRYKDGAYKFKADGMPEGECEDVCHILKGLDSIVAQAKYKDWLFLFGTIIASEALPTSDPFDYQFFNFAPLYKGYDPATSNGVGKKFIVPKRYVSQIDFLTPLRDITMRQKRSSTAVLELLDEADHRDDNVVINPHESGVKKYGSTKWLEYKSGLTRYHGYTMIEYGWFVMDGITFSIEICVDHLLHRALMTFMADLVTGSKTRIPSSSEDRVVYVNIPKEQAQIQLVSSGGMGINVDSIAVADGGYIFLQDGIFGDLPPSKTFNENPCQPNQYEFDGGAECVKRSAVISATDVTFEYEMIFDFEVQNLYPMKHWTDMIKGVFSRYGLYHPKLTIYDPVKITPTHDM